MKMLDNGIFENEYIINIAQIGIHKTLTNKSFLSLMENLAGAHSAYCHFSFEDLEKDNLGWIILSWKIKVFKRPKLDDKVRVQTWGRKFNNLFVWRDFRVFDENGELCAIATSMWCLIDYTKRKIAHMPSNLNDIYFKFPDKAVFGENSEEVIKVKIPDSDPINFDVYKVRRFDIDINKHVHNLNYVDIAYETLPFDVFMEKEYDNIIIEYKREIQYGEKVNSYLYQDGDRYVIVTKSEDENTIHSVIELS